MTEVINRFIYIDPIGTMGIIDKENDISSIIQFQFNFNLFSQSLKTIYKYTATGTIIIT